MHLPGGLHAELALHALSAAEKVVAGACLTVSVAHDPVQLIPGVAIPSRFIIFCSPNRDSPRTWAAFV